MTCELVALVKVTSAFWTSHSPSSPTLQTYTQKKKCIMNRLAHPLHAWRLIDTVSKEFQFFSLKNWHVFNASSSIHRNDGITNGAVQVNKWSRYILRLALLYFPQFCVCVCGLLVYVGSLNGDGSSGTYKAYNQNWQPHLNKYFPPGPCLSQMHIYILLYSSSTWLGTCRKRFNHLIALLENEDEKMKSKKSGEDYKFPIDNMFFSPLYSSDAND